jgi:hypothetical protein
LINLHIIGVQKAGTTALAHFLNQHPDIYVVAGKEAHACDHPALKNRTNKPLFIRQHFNKKLVQYNGQKLVCDATPITLFNPSYLENCYQYNPQAKFIVVLRDPVQRAISHFQMSRNNLEEDKNLLQAFMLEKRRMHKLPDGPYFPFNSVYRTQSYLQRGCYSKQLQNLFNTVPVRQVLVIEHRDLLQNHEKTLQTVFQFVQVKSVDIQASTIFPTHKQHQHWTDPLAIIYAKLYFLLRGETWHRWRKIIAQHVNAASN